MTQVAQGSTKEQVPPVLWGVLEWQMPDGMNAKQAQVVMRAFVEKTHCFNVMCCALGVNRSVGELYLKDWKTIPKGIVSALPKLQKVIMRNPARTLALLEKKLAPKTYSFGVTSTDGAVTAVYDRATSEINATAQGKSGWTFQAEREKRHWSITDVVKRLGERGVKTYDSNISKIEKIGVTPKSLLFFPLCELYGVRPELFGFVSAYGDRVKAWRKEKNAQTTQEA